MTPRHPVLARRSVAASAARRPRPTLSPAAPGAGADLALIERGQGLAAQYQCGACHRIPGVPGAQGTLGPALAQFARRSYIAGALPNRPEVLQHWLIDPSALRAGATMPSLGVSPSDAAALAAYLHTLR